jgi:hypothetical protein
MKREVAVGRNGFDLGRSQREVLPVRIARALTDRLAAYALHELD